MNTKVISLNTKKCESVGDELSREKDRLVDIGVNGRVGVSVFHARPHIDLVALLQAFEDGDCCSCEQVVVSSTYMGHAKKKKKHAIDQNFKMERVTAHAPIIVPVSVDSAEARPRK